MAEAVLSASLGVLFDRMASPGLLDFARREGLEEKLDKWRKMLKILEAVLDDAEEKKQDNGRGRRAVKVWLDNLRDLAYDVEDILDEFATEALRQKLTAGNQATTSMVLQNIIPACFTSFNMKLESEIEEITARFNEMVKLKDDLKLSETVDRRSSRTSQTVAPTSVVTEAHVYGRKKDKEALLQVLVGEKRSDAQLSVLPILGMGGMGKTTLAQLVYNDEQVQSFFDLKAWTCVSEDFDVVRVTKTVLKSVKGSSDDNDLNLLQVNLKEKLKGKRFLVVLDDLWNENYQDWTLLRAPFEAGAPGSMILITTRNHGVSSKTGTIPAYTLNELSNDFCLSILAHHSLGTEDFGAHLKLKDIGEKLARRCKGSPLAAKVLGGVLRNKVDLDEWKDVLNSNIWDITAVKNEIAPALMLSYHHLPSHLKRCFTYCSILPKDYVFEEEQLVLLWMAEGLIKPRKGRKQMEDFGREDFRNLLSRSFFQRSFNSKSRFVMHDLINDLAQQVAGDVCFRLEDKVGGNNEGRPSRKARHSSYSVSRYDDIKKFEVFNDLKCLRTFLPLMLSYSYGGNHLPRNVPFELLPKLKRLRVLSLKGYNIDELPESIGDLKHLRFLDLSLTEIRSLPESVGTLYNLQTLILEGCVALKKLPSMIGNLLNLRHLDISGCRSLTSFPEVGLPLSLTSLEIFNCSSLTSFPEVGLPPSLTSLSIHSCSNLTSFPEVGLPPSLTSLDIWGCSNLTSFPEVGLPPSLTSLSIWGCRNLTSFPEVGLPASLTSLDIRYCSNLTSFPEVGQPPSLTSLYIWDCSNLTSFPEVGLPPSLTSLDIRDCSNLTSFPEVGLPPSLTSLSIRDCSNLTSFPEVGLPLSLLELHIHNCPLLIERCKGRDWFKIAHIPHVKLEEESH